MLLTPAVVLHAQAGYALAVDHAVPFGTVPGKLLLLDNYLVFVDDQQLDTSFVVSKSDMESLSAEGNAITVQTRGPIRNRSGEVRRLNFRVAAGAEPAVVTSWYAGGVRSVPSASGSAAPASSAPASIAPASFRARHNHRFGACAGRLLIAPDQISFESLESVSHSRRWEYKSVQELKHPNPYELEIKPFTGGTYKIFLDGSGMDPAQYKELVDQVATARAGR